MMTFKADTETASAGGAGPIRIEVLEPIARFSLRVASADAKAVEGALGLTLPARVGERAVSGTREALCLGPDEWVITALEDEGPKIVEALAAIYDKSPHSLTDISDREVSILIEGPQAAELLSIGCPRDLDRLAPGRGVRTLFDDVQVVLRRESADRFRMDVWRSFCPHVLELLAVGNAEFAAA